MRIFNPAIETMPRADIKALQLERLQNAVKNVYENVPHYRERLDKAGVRPGDIKTLDDIRRIPFTVKDDLREHYPYGMFAVPMKKILRIHASSGTTGKPTVVGYTRGDLDNWAELVARLVVAGGGSDEDIAQISFGYGLFTGALGLHQGLEKLGAAVVPVSSGNTQRQISIMRDFGVTLLVATPSYAMYMAEVCAQMGIPREELKLKWGVFGSEPSTEGMRVAIEKAFGITVTENYGLSEIIGPGVAGECLHKCGMHVNEDHFLIEVIDPDTGESLPEGEVGEVVITTLNKEALPLLRYRTRDISRLIPDVCACGRTLARLEKMRGRSDDMLIVRGVNVFPSQIESVLMGIPGIGPHYEIILTQKMHLDQMEVKVELTDGTLLERFTDVEALRNRIRDQLKVILQIDTTVTLASPGALKRFEGKAKRVDDRRNS